MATYKGREGVVAIGAGTTATFAELRSWEVQESANVTETTRMGDTWQRNVQTQNSWNGSLECWWDKTDADAQKAVLIGSTITITVYPEGTGAGLSTLTGSAIVTGITTKASHDGVVEYSLSFTGDGALTKT